MKDFLERLCMWADFLRGVPSEWAEDEPGCFPLGVEALLCAVTIVAAIAASAIWPGPWFGG